MRFYEEETTGEKEIAGKSKNNEERLISCLRKDLMCSNSTTEAKLCQGLIITIQARCKTALPSQYMVAR
jgi:hypothetical protein